MTPYLQSCKAIDWQHPRVRAQAQVLKKKESWQTVIACFHFVRDQIDHSGDIRQGPLTYSASEVLEQGRGFCYAKSHLLAALLRANGIPCALVYQRLSLQGGGVAPFTLHGLNAVWLDDAWYRLDARGNKPGVDAQCRPPVEQLAFAIENPEQECLFAGFYVEPWPEVAEAYLRYPQFDEFRQQLPDREPSIW